MRIAELWDERGILYDKEKLNELIIVPDNAQYYAALGAVIFGEGENNHDRSFSGLIQLKTLVDTGGTSHNENNDTPLVSTPEELKAFKEDYTIKAFSPPKLTKKNHLFFRYRRRLNLI